MLSASEQGLLRWELMALQAGSCGQVAQEQPPVFSGLVAEVHQLQLQEKFVPSSLLCSCRHCLLLHSSSSGSGFGLFVVDQTKAVLIPLEVGDTAAVV